MSHGGELIAASERPHPWRVAIEPERSMTGNPVEEAEGSMGSLRRSLAQS